jgi:hypothetical protein
MAKKNRPGLRRIAAAIGVGVGTVQRSYVMTSTMPVPNERNATKNIFPREWTPPRTQKITGTIWMRSPLCRSASRSVRTEVQHCPKGQWRRLVACSKNVPVSHRCVPGGAPSRDRLMPTHGGFDADTP